MQDLAMNERAWALADGAEQRAVELRIAVRRLAGGTRLIDAGVDEPGGLGAGCLLAELCMGGLGHVAPTALTLAGQPWAGVHVWTDHPAAACMASQYAGWAVQHEGFFGMGSGPLRARARVEVELYERLGYHEAGASRGVLVLETRTLPSAGVAARIAEKAGVAADALTLAVAPTASLAGGVQVVARVVETALHKMEALGFDVNRVAGASGTAPLPPVARSDVRAIGRTNDCVLYGGQVRFTVDAADEELAGLAAQLPSSSSGDYGTPFYEIFKRYDSDFYKIDPMLFSPAEVWLSSVSSGRTFHGGRVNVEVLASSLYE